MRWKWVAGVGIVLAIVLLASSARGATRTKKRRVSVWWDVGGPMTIRHLNRHIANLKALGVSGVTIMLDEADGTINFNQNDLVEFASTLRVNGIAFGLDIWSRPTRQFVAERLPWVFALANGAGAQFIEFDTEGEWTSSRLRGYTSLDEAASGVAQAMRRSPVPWGITTFRERLVTTALSLGRYGNFIVPQAYSRVGNDDRIGAFPGSYQIKVYDQTRRAYGGMPVVMGLAAFDQEFPGMDPASAMIVAARASFDLGVNEVCFWSWKWIGGVDGTPRNQYAFDALARLRSVG